MQGSARMDEQSLQKLRLTPMLWLARAYLKDHNVDEAIRIFEECQKEAADPSPISMDGLGQAFHIQQKYEDALVEYDQACSESHLHHYKEEYLKFRTEFLKNRAQCYFDMKRYDKAADDLQTALQFEKHDSMCPKSFLFYRLGLTYFADGKFKKCIKILKQALKNRPYIVYETDIYYHIGLAYCKT